MTVNVLPFPSDASIAYSALDYFYRNRTYIWTVLGPVIFLARILITQVMLKGTRSYADLMRDLVMMTFCMLMFPHFVKLIVELPEIAHQALTSESSVEIQARPITTKDLSTFTSLFRFGLWGEIISLAVYYICYAVFQGLLFILVCMAAWAIMAGTLLNIPFLLPVFFFCLFLTSAWPLFWYGINIAMIEGIKAIPDPGLISKTVITLAADFARLIAPVFLIRSSWHSKLANFAKDRIAETGSAIRSSASLPGKALSGGKAMASGSASRLASAAQATGFHKESQWIRNSQVRAGVRYSALTNSIKERSKASAQKVGPTLKSALAVASTGGLTAVKTGATAFTQLKNKRSTANSSTSENGQAGHKTGATASANMGHSAHGSIQQSPKSARPSASVRANENHQAKASHRPKGLGSAPATGNRRISENASFSKIESSSRGSFKEQPTRQTMASVPRTSPQGSVTAQPRLSPGKPRDLTRAKRNSKNLEPNGGL